MRSAASSTDNDEHISQRGNVLALGGFDFLRVVFPLGFSHFLPAAPYNANVKGALPLVRHGCDADEHVLQLGNLFALVGIDFFGAVIPFGSSHFQHAAPYQSNVRGTVSPLTRHSCNADGHIYQCGNLLAIMGLRVVMPLSPSHF